MMRKLRDKTKLIYCAVSTNHNVILVPMFFLFFDLLQLLYMYIQGFAGAYSVILLFSEIYSIRGQSSSLSKFFPSAVFAAFVDAR